MGSMNFGRFPIADRIKEFRFDWEADDLEASRDYIFRNTYKDIEYILQERSARPRRRVRVRVLRRRPPLQPRPLPRSRAGQAAPLRADDLRHPRRHRHRSRGSAAHEADGRPPLRRRLSSGRSSAPGGTRFNLVTMGAIMGGNVRVGLEDNIYLGKGELAKNNGELVAKIGANPARSSRWRSPRRTRPARCCSSKACTTWGSDRLTKK